MIQHNIRIVIICLLAVSLVTAQEVRQIEVDINTKYQVIDNFAASDCWSFQKIGAWVPAQKEKVADLLFSQDKGIGLSAWRFNIGGGLNFTSINSPWRTVETFEVSQGQYDWSRQQEERWFLQAAKERGVDQFIAFVNSPPARMTRNGLTNCSSGVGSTNLKEGYEEQYATYLADILKQFRDEWGIAFNYISPVNEPQWEWNSTSQEGNRAANADIKRIVSALHAELQRQDLSSAISLTESGDLESWYRSKNAISDTYGQLYGNYLQNLIKDPDIENKIARHLAGHSYWSDRVSNQLVQHRQILAGFMEPFFNEGWKYWMTEYAVLDGPQGQGGQGRDLSINTALDVLRVLHYDLTLLNASAWQWWTAISPEDFKDGLLYTDYRDNPQSQTIIESKLLWAFGNFSRFIRPGSVRLKLTGADDKFALLGTAFLNAEANKLILVFINMSNTPHTLKINVTGFPATAKLTKYTLFVTSDNSADNLKEYGPLNAQDGVSIAAQSVVTLVGSISDSATGPGTLGEIPRVNKLYQNYPNPFNQKTDIFYYMTEAGTVEISIYSMLGRKIKTLLKKNEQSGFHRTSWDGKNSDNQQVSSGVYLYGMLSGKDTDHKKMVFIQ